MLSLVVNGTSLDLSQDFSITLKFSSPIFNTVGDYTYPFKIPVTPLNLSTLGFKHRVENSGDPYEEYDASLFYNDLLLLEGILRITKAQTDFYEATLYLNKGDFYYKLKNQSLQDVDFGTMSWTGETLKMDWINSCKNKFYPERNLAFPMLLNKSYFDELPPEPQLQYFNYYDYGTMYYFTPSAQPYDRTVIVPMLFLRYVLDKLFEYLQFELDDSFFSSDPDYNALILYNLVDCNTGPTGYFSYDKLKIFLNYHVPRISLKDFFINLETYFNIRFFVNNTTKVAKLVSVDKIVKSTDYVEFSSQVISIALDLENKITGFDFKLTMDTNDERFPVINAGQQVVLDRIKSSVQSVCELAPWPASSVGDLRFVFDLDQYWVMNTTKLWQATTAMYWTWNMYSQWIYKNKDQSIESKFSSPCSEEFTPYNAIIGNPRSNWAAYIPTLAFAYYQEAPYDNGFMASRGFTIDNNNLWVGGHVGLINKHYKAYFDFRMTAKCLKITKQMTFLELKELDFSRKYMIGGNKYLLSEVQVTMTKGKMNPAIIKAYSCF